MGSDELTIRQARDWCLRFGDLYRERRPMVIRCFEAGMTRKEIAAKTGLARQTISQWITEHELRAELAEAAAEVEPSPGALDAIQARIAKT